MDWDLFLNESELLVPILGTKKTIDDYKEDPSFFNGLMVALSGASDVASVVPLIGPTVGSGVKIASGALKDVKASGIIPRSLTALGKWAKRFSYRHKPVTLKIAGKFSKNFARDPNVAKASYVEDLLSLAAIRGLNLWINGNANWISKSVVPLGNNRYEWHAPMYQEDGTYRPQLRETTGWWNLQGDILKSAANVMNHGDGFKY